MSPRHEPSAEQTVGRAAARLDALGLPTRRPDAPAVGGWVPAQPPASPEPAPAAPGRLALLERLSDRVSGVALAPGGRALAWLALVCCVCIAVTAYTVLHHRGGSSMPPYDAAPSGPLAVAPSASPVAQIVVDVGGRVRRPGLVSLPMGARVADAIRAAGGALRAADLLRANLAARVSDGQLLLVGVPGGLADSAGNASSGPLDLNSATADQLDALRGVGPVLAQHIIDWRTAHGGFSSVDQLRQVSGIGDAKFSQLRSLVSA